ncbi:hypothetical protein [uncultured Roseobacter sp.]|uniref:hypothetical protein n=1 Tax=uncultured Roseobacter sp. TaxID=114847 RepID=UPI0026309E22|nr:hypothetical protein [uncultured Roseobacter sp.]
MSDDDRFRPDLSRKTLDRFARSARPNDFQSFSARLNATEIAAAEKRSAEVREKAREHFQKMKPIWTARESRRLSRENPEQLTASRREGPKPPNRDSNQAVSRQRAIAEQAASNVKSRCDERIRRIEKIEHRMVRSIQRTRKNKR